MLCVPFVPRQEREPGGEEEVRGYAHKLFVCL